MQNDDGHGGVGIHTLNVKIYIFIPHFFEYIYIFIEVQNNNNKPITVGVVYRPNSAPHTDIDMFMSEIIEIQDKVSNENCLFYG